MLMLQIKFLTPVPHEFLCLSEEIFCFVNFKLITNIRYITNMVTSIITNVLKILDTVFVETVSVSRFNCIWYSLDPVS